MLLKLYEKNNNPQDLQQVVDILNDGGLIYPTDTMYAIGCHGLKERAIEQRIAISRTLIREKSLYHLLWFEQYQWICESRQQHF